LACSNAARLARIGEVNGVNRPTIAPSIDLDSAGKRIGHLELAWSDDEHAYGVIPVPIAVIARGSGPSVLVTAGVHGDEYEGLVIARRLIAGLSPDDVTGRIVVIPGVNWPAVRARRRVSPIDRQNMNRAFPGDGGSGPTAMIAGFIERALLPGMTYAADLHSGGTQSIYAPCGYVYGMGERAFRERKLAAAHAFGAPRTAVVTTMASRGSLSAACERHGVAMVSTELGGGAALSHAALAIGWEGTLNLLRHAGALSGAPKPTRTALLHTAGRAAFVMATIDGLFEPTVDVGARVEAGDRAGTIWPVDDLTRESFELRFAVGGTVLARRTMPMVVRGDYVCHVGQPMTDDAFLEGP
jgi:predicted deacylase